MGEGGETKELTLSASGYKILYFQVTIATNCPALAHNEPLPPHYKSKLIFNGRLRTSEHSTASTQRMLSYGDGTQQQFVIFKHNSTLRN
jgi:hypothetical protein